MCEKEIKKMEEERHETRDEEAAPADEVRNAETTGVPI